MAGSIQTEVVQARLREYYNRKNIAVHNFKCPHLESCVRDATPRPLTHGAEAHVGSRYGEITKVAIISLDSGGSSSALQARREVIESITEPNPHMAGTIRTLEALLSTELAGASPLAFFAMINAAKCSATDRPDMVKSSLYNRCRGFARDELEMLVPDVIVAQGVQARKVIPLSKPLSTEWMNRALSRTPEAKPPIRSWITAIANEYLRVGTLGTRDVILMHTPHPSARAGQWQKFDRLCLDQLAWLVQQLLKELA